MGISTFIKESVKGSAATSTGLVAGTALYAAGADTAGIFVGGFVSSVVASHFISETFDYLFGASDSLSGLASGIGLGVATPLMLSHLSLEEAYIKNNFINIPVNAEIQTAIEQDPTTEKTIIDGVTPVIKALAQTANAEYAAKAETQFNDLYLETPPPDDAGFFHDFSGALKNVFSWSAGIRYFATTDLNYVNFPIDDQMREAITHNPAIKNDMIAEALPFMTAFVQKANAQHDAESLSKLKTLCHEYPQSVVQAGGDCAQFNVAP